MRQAARHSQAEADVPARVGIVVLHWTISLAARPVCVFLRKASNNRSPTGVVLRQRPPPSPAQPARTLPILRSCLPIRRYLLPIRRSRLPIRRSSQPAQPFHLQVSNSEGADF